jgi:hypothetical protein
MLCLALGWLSIVGVGNCYLLLTGQFAGLPAYLGVFMAAYVLSALFACIGLWRMKMWGLRSLRIWMMVSLSMAIAVIPVFDAFSRGETLAILGFTLLVALLFWVLNRYVASQVSGVRQLCAHGSNASDMK